MNINVKVGRKALMMSIALIAATVATACGNDTGTVATSATTAPQQEYRIIPGTYQGDVESLWAKIAGKEIEPTKFAVDVDGPLYGPSPNAGNFDATGRVGTKCIAVFEKGMTGSTESLLTSLYVETGDKMVPWAARDGSEANIAGANRLIAHFHSQCA